MRRVATPVIAWLLAVPLPAAAGDAPEDCAARLHAGMEADLALSWQAFDQTPGQGFRRLAEAGCPREAGDLIEAWIARNGPTHRSLHWHLAQMRGEAGQMPEAIAAARASLRADEPEDAPFRWNDYVLAVIAVFERDRAAFDRHRDRVAAFAHAHAGNAMNLRFLDRLGARFDAGYAGALRD